jgi:hypothetical protein
VDRPAGVPDCGSRGWGGGEPCEWDNCAFINFSVRGFLSRYTCTIQRFGRLGDVEFAVDPVQPAGGNSIYYGSPAGGQVALNCTTPDFKPDEGGYQSGGTGWKTW